MLLVDADPTKISSLCKRDRTILNPGKKTKKKDDPPVTSDELTLPDLDDERKQRFSAGLRDFEHMWHPEYNGSCTVAEHHIDNYTGSLATVFKTVYGRHSGA